MVTGRRFDTTMRRDDAGSVSPGAARAAPDGGAELLLLLIAAGGEGSAVQRAGCSDGQ